MLSASVYANMRLVIKEAKNNLKNNQIPIGALIVYTLTNEIIAKAANTDSPVGPVSYTHLTLQTICSV